MPTSAVHVQISLGGSGHHSDLVIPKEACDTGMVRSFRAPVVGDVPADLELLPVAENVVGDGRHGHSWRATESRVDGAVRRDRNADFHPTLLLRLD